MRKINLIFLFVILPVISGCGQRRAEEKVRGRLKYVVTAHLGSAGGHGYRQGWITDDRQFYVDGRKWSPERFDLKENISECEPSPNETVEVFRCYGGYVDGQVRDASYILRVKDNGPEWIKIMDGEEVETRGENKGEWFGDGKWLIFKDRFYNVETGKRREINPLPVYPSSFHFRAVSPDMKTIVYQHVFCSDERGHDLKGSNYVKVCEKENAYRENRIEIVWLIDAETGEAEFLELSRDKYPQLFKDVQQDGKSFQQYLVWKGDGNGRDRLIYPN